MEFLNWEDVKNSPEYKALSPAGKRAAKKQYPFNKEESLKKALVNDSMIATIQSVAEAVSRLEGKVAALTLEVPAPIVNVPDMSDSFNELGMAILNLEFDNSPELNKIVNCLESLERQIEGLSITVPETDNSGIENVLTQIKSKLSEEVMDTTVTKWEFEFKRDNKDYIRSIEATAVRTLN